MDKKFIQRCKVCGAEYEVCYVCEKDKSWRMLTDTAEHYEVLIAIMEYQYDHDAEKAYHSLQRSGVDFTSIEGYIPSVQQYLMEIKSRHEKQTVFALSEDNSDEVLVPIEE